MTPFHLLFQRKRDTEDMASLEENKRTVSRYVEAFNQGESEALRPLFTPDAVVQGVLGKAAIETALAIWRELHEAYATELRIEEMVAEGEMVAVRYTEAGTSRKPFRGRPATGKSYAVTAMEWFQMRDGLIAQRWGARDSAAISRQLESE